MADTVPETKESPVGTPEKKPEKKIVDKSEAEEVKASVNGVESEIKENGTGKEEAKEDKEVESSENGVSKEEEETVPVKRKSEGGDAPDGVQVEGVSPEKKAKLDDKNEVTSEAEAVA